MSLLRDSTVPALTIVISLTLAGVASADDVESKVKYDQVRTRWKMDETRRKFEADRARMKQDRENRARNLSSPTLSAVSSRGGNSTRSTQTASVQPAGNGMNWYTNKQQNFRGLFMGKPEVSSKAGPMGTTCNFFSYSNNQGATIISVTALPVVPSDQAGINRSLNGACDGSVKSGGAVETGRYSCSLQGHPGREFTANIPDKKGKMKSRLYLANKRLYQVLVIGEAGFVDSSFGQQFIKSFSFL